MILENHLQMVSSSVSKYAVIINLFGDWGKLWVTMLLLWTA